MAANSNGIIVHEVRYQHPGTDVFRGNNDLGLTLTYFLTRSNFVVLETYIKD